MPPKGGIKRRLEQADGNAPSAEQFGVSESSSSVPLGGGVARRVARAQACSLVGGTSASSQSSSSLPLNASLKRRWAQGKITSPLVQEFAMGAAMQGATGLGNLPFAGNSGKHVQNLQRALVNAFGMPDGAPDFSWYDIPTKRGVEKIPFLMPHKFFKSLYGSRKQQFMSSIAGPPGAARDYWIAKKNTAFVRNHPHLSESDFDKVFPLGFHGDGGAYCAHNSLYAFSWNGVLSAGTLDSRHYLFCLIPKSDIVEGTFDTIFEIFSWSMNVLLTGLTPDYDFDGSKIEGEVSYLADGMKAALCQARGDWEFYVQAFAIPRWDGAECMCWLCKASGRDDDLRHTRSDLDSGWRRTRRTHESYLREFKNKGIAVPVLLRSIVGFRLECILIDILHTVDLGVAAHIIANIFVELINQRAFSDGNQDKNVIELEKKMISWCKSNKDKSRLKGKLTMERLKTSGAWPKLKASAAATRHLVKFALKLCIDFDSGSVHDRRRLGVCQLLDRFYTIIDAETDVLSDAAREVLPEIGRNLVMLYGSLAEEAVGARLKLWKFVPKFHLFVHLCEWQAVEEGNPRFYWTYQDEDLVGKMIEVAENCHTKTMSLTALYKWLLFAFD